MRLELGLDHRSVNVRQDGACRSLDACGTWARGHREGQCPRRQRDTVPALPDSKIPMARLAEIHKVRVRRAKAKIVVRESYS